jgi:hypothetical protein
MKAKIKILIVSCMIATAAITGLNLAQDSNSMAVTLADIAVMAKADGENGPCPGWDGSSYCQWDDDYANCVDQAECNSSCPGGC